MSQGAMSPNYSVKVGQITVRGWRPSDDSGAWKWIASVREITGMGGTAADALADLERRAAEIVAEISARKSVLVDCLESLALAQ